MTFWHWQHICEMLKKNPMEKHKGEDKTQHMNGSENSQNQEEEAQEATEQQQQSTNESGDENTAETDAETGEGENEEDPLAQKQAEYQELYDKHLRLYSEFENFRRRSRKDVADAKEKGRSEIVLTILPVIDDFERALDSINESTESQEVYDGVELIYNKFKNLLNEQGLEEMQPKGQPFDPEYHEAMTKTQAPSKEEKGKVVDVVEKGYMLNDRIVRHAKVVVGE